MAASRARKIMILVVALLLFCLSVLVLAKRHLGPAPKSSRLYWFVPDGLRADPTLFNIYAWAEQGKLPNIKRMMEQGSFGYSIPVFPSHTPVNFATLFTGTSPERHGVTDGPLRIFGYPLNMISRSGFSSLAKTIDPFWYTLEQAGMTTTLLSIPGSTPPEISTGNVVKGRWGGWGMELPAMIFHAHRDVAFRKLVGWNDRVFQTEKKLLDFTKASDATGWQTPLPASFSPVREVNLNNWDAELFALIVDSTNDGLENYDHVYFSRDKKSFIFHLMTGQWSDWFNLNIGYVAGRNFQETAPHRLSAEERLSTVRFDTQVRIKIIKLGQRDFFRIRLLYDGLNESMTKPESLSAELRAQAGPMVDFVDNYPPQLIYFPEDKATFDEEAAMSFTWHQKAEKYFLQKAPQDVFIQSIYSPNQMLTSRWWMGSVDPKSIYYNETTELERRDRWSEILHMYQQVDQMIGVALDARPADGYVVLSSDHGAAPLNYEVKLNNLFARKGWLKFTANKVTGSLQIDWAHTKVIFLKMNHIYINPRGLSGNYQPASGPEFEAFLTQVESTLKELKDEGGIAPLSLMFRRPEAKQYGLIAERVGDLVIANRLGYNWIEDVSEDLQIFSRSLKTGYKQAIVPDDEPALWTPFMIVGPGIRAGHRLSRPIRHVEQYPTIMRALKIAPTYTPDAPALEEVFGK